MDAVGNAAYGDFIRRPARKEWLKEMLAHLPMQGTDAIHVDAAVDGQPSHVEWLPEVFRIGPAQRQDLLQVNAKDLGCAFDIAGDEFRREAIEASGYRRVRRKDVAGAGGVQGTREVAAMVAHVTMDTRQDGEGGMPFVQVTDIYLYTEMAQQQPTACTQADLLLQARFRAAAVEFGGNAPVGRSIEGIVTV